METDKKEMEENESKRYFGSNALGKKDPASDAKKVRILDIFIVVMIVVAILVIIYYSSNGGYTVSFDSTGGSEVTAQSRNYGEYADIPENPTRPGYVFAGWAASADTAELWNFAANPVEGSITLYALWQPAEITVKLDLDGGILDTGLSGTISVTYGGSYGALPTPVKEGYHFGGWLYSGELISAETIVITNGEHVLTAVWEQGE